MKTTEQNAELERGLFWQGFFAKLAVALGVVSFVCACIDLALNALP